MNDLRHLSGRLCVLLILLVGGLAHGLCLGADFYMDDGIMLTPDFLAWDGPWRAGTMRIVPQFLSAMTFAIFGDSSVAQHVWNLLIHLSLALTVFWGTSVFLEAGKVFAGRAGMVRRASLFAALIFACHPMCTEAVNYARCTRIQLVTLFSVLAAIGTIKFCQRPNWRVALGISAVVVLAMLSKDPGLLHAIGNVMIVALVFANRDAITSRLRRPIDWAVALLSIGAFFWIGLNGFTMGWLRRAERAFFSSSIDFWDHALTQGRVFWAYAQRLVLPVNLSVDHHLPMSRGLADTPALLMTLGLGLLVAAVLWMMLSRRWRLWGVLAMLALAPLLLRFLYPISELMVEYRVYPAMPWLAMLAGVGLAVLFQMNQQVMKFAVLFLVVGGVLGSAMRSAVWQDGATLAQDVVDQYPTNNRARNELQRLSYEAGDYQRVYELHGEVLGAVAAVNEYNASYQETGRTFLIHRCNLWYLASEARVAQSLAESVGSRIALAHLDEVERRTRAQYPEYFDEGGEFYENVERLVELREAIGRFGLAHDRKLLEQASAGDVGEP